MVTGREERRELNKPQTKEAMLEFITEFYSRRPKPREGLRRTAIRRALYMGATIDECNAAVEKAR